MLCMGLGGQLVKHRFEARWQIPHPCPSHAYALERFGAQARRARGSFDLLVLTNRRRGDKLRRPFHIFTWFRKSVYAWAAFSAWSMSAMMSFTSSIPMESLMKSGLTPEANCSSAESC